MKILRYVCVITLAKNKKKLIEIRANRGTDKRVPVAVGSKMFISENVAIPI